MFIPYALLNCSVIDFILFFKRNFDKFVLYHCTFEHFLFSQCFLKDPFFLISFYIFELDHTRVHHMTNQYIFKQILEMLLPVYHHLPFLNSIFCVTIKLWMHPLVIWWPINWGWKLFTKLYSAGASGQQLHQLSKNLKNNLFVESVN